MTGINLTLEQLIKINLDQQTKTTAMLRNNLGVTNK